MAFDLKDHPVSLPNQPVVTLADIYRFCGPCDVRFQVEGVARSDRQLKQQERSALIELAFHVASLRGTDTIASLALDEMLQAGDQMICPLTLEATSSELDRAYLRPHCEHACVEAAPMDFLAQMLGWSPFDLWGREREKQQLSNFVPINHLVAKTMRYACHGAFVPTRTQLSKLVVELEARLATAISSAEPAGSWSVSTEFGASTALTSVEVWGETSSSVRHRQPFLAHAHEYDFIGFPFSPSGPKTLVVHNDSPAAAGDEHKTSHRSVTYHDHGAYLGSPSEFKPPLPPLAAFLSPAAAVASFVFRANRKVRKWRTRSEERIWDMCVYFCRLMTSVTSGASFAATLATRPQDDHLPKLASDVEACARNHAGDEEHRRAFPTFDPPLPADGDRKRKRPDRGGESEGQAPNLPHPGELRVYEVDRVSRGPGGSSSSAGYGADVFHSWRVAREGSKAHRECDEEVFRSAFWHYETAYNRHTRALVRAFDNGRGGASLFDVLSGGWEAFYQGCGVEQGKELEELRARLLEAAEGLLEWLGKVVEHRRAEAT